MSTDGFSLGLDHLEALRLEDLRLEDLRLDGFTLLRGVIPREPLQRIRRRMDRDSEDLLRFVNARGGNPRARGHLQQGPPPFADYVIGDVAMNEHVVEICRAVLGPDLPYLSFYNGNTNYPGSEWQHVHLDDKHLTDRGSPAGPTYALVVNIPPGPCTTANGAIELWPGTHRLAEHHPNKTVPDERLESRRRERPPLQPQTEPGDVLIRDIRLWHRGAPNESDRARHMMALVVTAGWRQPRRRLEFGLGCEQALSGRGIDPNAEFTTGPIDYLFGPSKAIFERRRQA